MADDPNWIDLKPYLEKAIPPEDLAPFDDYLVGIETTPITITGTWNSQPVTIECALCRQPRPASEGFGSLNHPALGRIAPVCLSCGLDWA